MVWIGTSRALPSAPRRRDPDPETGYAFVEEVAGDAPVRARFASPHVTYVGSHEGCGCGYHSGGLAFQSVATVADARALIGAMTDEERAEFAAEQHSRERLRALVERERSCGPVELFACWAGDEIEPAVATRGAECSWLTDQLEPFDERVLYVIGPAVSIR
jgi:hypothetical protein